MALITKWQLTIIIRTCFIVYRALPDFLLSHLNTFPFLLMPWGFTNTASHRGRVHASTRMYTHIRTHVHRSSLCVGSAMLTLSSMMDKGSIYRRSHWWGVYRSPVLGWKLLTPRATMRRDYSLALSLDTRVWYLKIQRTDGLIFLLDYWVISQHVWSLNKSEALMNHTQHCQFKQEKSGIWKRFKYIQACSLSSLRTNPLCAFYTHLKGHIAAPEPFFLSTHDGGGWSDPQKWTHSVEELALAHIALGEAIDIFLTCVCIFLWCFIWDSNNNDCAIKQQKGQGISWPSGVDKYWPSSRVIKQSVLWHQLPTCF